MRLGPPRFSERSLSAIRGTPTPPPQERCCRSRKCGSPRRENVAAHPTYPVFRLEPERHLKRGALDAENGCAISAYRAPLKSRNRYTACEGCDICSRAFGAPTLRSQPCPLGARESRFQAAIGAGWHRPKWHELRPSRGRCLHTGREQPADGLESGRRLSAGGRPVPDIESPRQNRQLADINSISL